MAAITDKFNKAANGTGIYPSIASVSAIREKNGSILTCDDLSGWSTDTPVHFSTYRLLPDGTVDTSTQSDWKGIVNGNTITQIIRLAGNSDSGHLVGDKVELNPTIGWLDDLITGILKSHNQDGTIKDGVIQTKNIADKAITSNKIAAKAIRSQNIDFETFPGYVYSTEEQIVGIWTDGKLIYKRTFTGIASSNGTVVVNGRALNIDTLIGAEGTIDTIDGQRWVFPSSNSDAKKANVFMNTGNKEVHLIIGSYMNNMSYTVTLRYTKTAN